MENGPHSGIENAPNPGMETDSHLGMVRGPDQSLENGPWPGIGHGPPSMGNDPPLGMGNAPPTGMGKSPQVGIGSGLLGIGNGPPPGRGNGPSQNMIGDPMSYLGNVPHSSVFCGVRGSPQAIQGVQSSGFYNGKLMRRSRFFSLSSDGTVPPGTEEDALSPLPKATDSLLPLPNHSRIQKGADDVTLNVSKSNADSTSKEMDISIDERSQSSKYHSAGSPQLTYVEVIF